jgi:histidinol-phosphate aminotransferase
MKKLTRNAVLKIEQYEPGKSIETIKKELALGGEIYKLASNENPLGPSSLAIQAIKKSLTEGHIYPDNNCQDLREKLAEYIGISPLNIGIGNGTTELIFLMGVAFLNPRDAFIMSESSFIMGKMVAQLMDSNLIEVPLKNFRHDLEAVLKEITKKTKIVYLDNPMNPIGTMITEKEVSDLMEKIPPDIMVAFDEAYYDYVDSDDYPNTLKFVQEGRNVIIFRTFSKLYGLAGLRIGYCLAKQGFIEAIRRVSPPFAVNRLAQVGAAAALRNQEHRKKTIRINESGKMFLYKNFEKLSLFYIPSETNFVTVDIETDSQGICEELKRKGVIVRPLTMYGKPTFIRVTVGTPEQNQKFVEAFEEILPNPRRNAQKS